jgi:hypothetical protein
MTTRERASLILVLLGAVALIIAAYAHGGWVLAVATAGGLMVAGGVLLGLDDDESLEPALGPDELP